MPLKWLPVTSQWVDDITGKIWGTLVTGERGPEVEFEDDERGDLDPDPGADEFGGGLLQGERPGLQDPVITVLKPEKPKLPVVSGGAVGAEAASPLTMSMSGVINLVTKTAPVWAPTVRSALAALGKVGERIGWFKIPKPIRDIIVASGVVKGTDVVLEEILGNGNGEITVLDRDMMPAGPGMQHVIHGPNVVGSWVSNGVTFYKLANGTIAVQKKSGVWKVWRPRKPIVLYSNGAKDLRTMLRADRALDRQAKQLAKVLSRRAPKSSSRRAPRQATLVEVVNPGRRIGE